jgi:hypothetical protein
MMLGASMLFVQACATTDDTTPFGIGRDASLVTTMGASGTPGAPPPAAGGAASSGGSTGSCQPSYCPAVQSGAPCCTSSGVCGVDFGMGCSPAPRDAGFGTGGYSSNGGSFGNGGYVGSGGATASGSTTGSGGNAGGGGAAGGGGGPPPVNTDASVVPDNPHP